MGQTIEVGKSHLYCSPLRSDSKPNCYFRWYNGKLWLMDHGFTNDDCISAYMKLHHVGYWDALKQLKYGCRGIKKIHKEEPKEQCEKKIRVKPYWKQAHQDYWDVRIGKRPDPNRVFGVTSYTIDQGCEATTWFPQDLCFAYKFDEEKYKLYFPERKKPRFMSNLKQHEVWWELRQSNEALITKSHKEFIEWCEHSQSDITLLQSEGLKTIPFEWDMYSKITLAMDSDQAGVNVCKRILENIQVPTQLFFVPNEKSVPMVEELLANCLPNVAAWYKNKLGHPVALPSMFDYYMEGKDLDELITRNQNHKEIIEWLLN